jgi:hypothetical protein
MLQHSYCNCMRRKLCSTAPKLQDFCRTCNPLLNTDYEYCSNENIPSVNNGSITLCFRDHILEKHPVTKNEKMQLICSLCDVTFADKSYTNYIRHVGNNHGMFKQCLAADGHSYPTANRRRSEPPVPETNKSNLSKQERNLPFSARHIIPNIYSES